MADSIYAAASTTPTPSSERIANEFMAQGNPSSVQNTIADGGIMGGFEIKTRGQLRTLCLGLGVELKEKQE